ncbi:AAA family ATPase [Acuticoccus kandeliae]|uniref:AAA family ATPase n=1 Tax=Acuticoccus kandeliae TaxID=2073160 RepID=UPI000D3E0D41|nr:AAA family ATPase [Acuticoccus kandeliae]
MKYIIKTVEIRHLWKSRHVKINLNDDLNFIIGRNGSGKTTIVKAISAALLLDLETLSKIDFSSIEITLRNQKDRLAASVSIDRAPPHLSGGFGFKYLVTLSNGERIQSHLDTYTGILSQTRGLGYLFPRNAPVADQVSTLEISDTIRNLVEVEWLPVHRHTGSINTIFPGSEHLDSIGSKTKDTAQKISEYYSFLFNASELSTDEFHKQVLFSYFDTSPNVNDVRPEQFTQELQKNATSALIHFGINPKTALYKTKQYFKFLDRSANKFRNDPSEANFEDFSRLSDGARVKAITELWMKTSQRQEQITRPIDVFLNTINSMLTGKRIIFDQSNIPKVQMNDGELIDVDELSSGERQLFIILGDTLVQRERPISFISDEPELSLHISWQEVLFHNIRTLNENSQIITATHSPDIISGNRSKIIRIEDFMHDD